ncbi:MAG: SigE family RNA polymerase sigma factor [Nocardioides sp.]|nr:SigE family RNA polymerase sigma factor [Nocardioides sp.]
MSATTILGETRPIVSKDEDFTHYMTARQPAMLRLAYVLTGDTASAEDLVQVAFAKLYLAWNRVEERGALDGYVRRILVNEHNSSWRRPWRRRERVSDTLPDSPVLDTYDDGGNAELWQLVQSLPPRQRSVIVLRYYEQLSEAEIADVLGVSPGTVKSQASKALASLRGRTPRSLATGEDG